MEIAEEDLGRSPLVTYDGTAEVGTRPFGTFEVAAKVRNQALIFLEDWLCLLNTLPQDFCHCFIV